jgi:putative membrane protein
MTPRPLSREEQARIARAIHDCERRTGSQIVCVLAETALIHPTGLPIAIAAILALALPWVLVAWTQLSVQTVLMLQVLLFLALISLGCLPSVGRILTPSPIRRVLAWRLAAEQFVVRGISHTPTRNGILIFVARAERYARIIADSGIADRVPAPEWQAAVDNLVGHMRADRAAEGFVTTIGICGQVLERHGPFPATDRNALPDKVYQI